MKSSLPLRGQQVTVPSLLPHFMAGINLTCAVVALSAEKHSSRLMHHASPLQNGRSLPGQAKLLKNLGAISDSILANETQRPFIQHAIIRGDRLARGTRGRRLKNPARPDHGGHIP